MGKGAVAGAAVVGLGALCYYGVGMGKHTSIADNAMWVRASPPAGDALVHLSG